MIDANYYFSTPFFPELWDKKTVCKVLECLSSFLQQLPLGKVQIDIPEGVYLGNRSHIFIGEGTVIEPGAYIKGPVWIGKGCRIGHGAYIRENVLLGDGSVVGHCSEIKNSMLFPHAIAAHFNYVGDCILGAHTNLGAGVKCANVRFDKKEISIRIENKKIVSGLKKMGLILGDYSQIGCNAVTNPGTLIGQKVFCHPGTIINGFIPSINRDKT